MQKIKIGLLFLSLYLTVFAANMQSSTVFGQFLKNNAIQSMKLLSMPILTVLFYRKVVWPLIFGGKFAKMYERFQKRTVKSYIKQATVKSFLSLIELDFGGQELKKERQKARKMVWEQYFHLMHKSFNVPALKLISELNSHQNSFTQQEN